MKRALRVEIWHARCHAETSLHAVRIYISRVCDPEEWRVIELREIPLRIAGKLRDGSCRRILRIVKLFAAWKIT